MHRFFSVPYTPYFPHIHGYRSLSKTNSDQFLTLSYENMKRDPEGEIRKIAKFLKLELSDEEAKEIAKKTTFKAMKENPATNYKVSEAALVPHLSFN